MAMHIDKYKEYAPVALRVGISLVFLWFGMSQLLSPADFLGYLPDWAVNSVQMMHMRILAPSGISILLIRLNGLFETVFGTLLLFGLFTRVSSFFLALHLAGITLNLGYNEIAVRDFGLVLAAISVFLHGQDKLALDNRMKGRMNRGKLKFLYLFG